MMIWIAGSIILGILFGCLGYFRPKAANGLFLLSILAFGYGAVQQVKFTGAIHELSTGVGESIFVEFVRKLGWTFEVFKFLPSHVQTAIFVYIGTFFIARILAMVASVKWPITGENNKQRRKRILKSFGMKNMKELRSKY